jgi:CheY-like chemotaxis protein
MTSKLGGYILVIEDDQGVRDGITNVIENEGYPVISCEDAKEALDRLTGTADLPRMIVLDFMMPKMDGWTFLHERDKNDRLRDIPVLGMSASQLLVERPEPPAGVDEFLRKPFKVEAMLRSIEKHWGPHLHAP